MFRIKVSIRHEELLKMFPNPGIHHASDAGKFQTKRWSSESDFGFKRPHDTLAFPWELVRGKHVKLIYSIFARGLNLQC